MASKQVLDYRPGEEDEVVLADLDRDSFTQKWVVEAGGFITTAGDNTLVLTVAEWGQSGDGIKLKVESRQTVGLPVPRGLCVGP